MILEELRRKAEEAVSDWAKANALERPAELSLAAPPAHVPADASLPWPLSAAKALKRRPLEVAGEIAGRLAAAPGIASAEAAPPGFVNIRWDSQALAENLRELLGSPGSYGGGAPAAKRSVLIEFVSANPTGPVHLASGRAATLGDSLARILNRRGHSAKTEYYVNDAGRQVELLGLSVKARFEQLRGKDAPLPEDGYQGEYIRDIAQAAPADAADWDGERFSRFAVERMLDSHREDMKTFGVEFDRWFRESELHQRGALPAALKKLTELGRVHEKDGAVWLGARGEDEDDKDRVLVRSGGRPTYFLADIAYHQDKLDRGFTELVDILGADHHGYVPRMKDAVAALGYPKGTFLPIIHQLVRLFRGRDAVKMSKRAGEFISLRELVNEVGVDACRFFFARHTPDSHMNFDIELAKKQTQENPVYYIQYVHARIASIFREAGERGISAEPAAGDALKLLTHPSERALLVKLAWFPEVLRTCERELSPHPLPGYLLELGALYHAFYEQCRVLDQDAPELSRARLALCRGVQCLVKEGLALLGVSAPERM